MNRPIDSPPNAPLPAGTDVDTQLAQAIAHHGNGELDAAETLYRQVLAQAPSNFDALHLLGVVQHQKGRHQAAVELIRNAVGIEPRAAAAHSNLGLALAKLGRFDEALASHDRALSLDPGNVEALNNRGSVLLSLKRHADAVASYDEALSRRPGHAAALRNRGVALAALNRHADALASYDRALAFRDDDVEALIGRGHALASLGRHAEALATYARALARQPDHVEMLKNRGDALVDLKRHAEALASYDRAIALEPGHVGALNNRANLLVELNRHEDALADYDRALALEPGYVESLVNRGNVLLDLSRNEDALASYDRALALGPDNANVLVNRGNALLALKQHGGALACYDRALALGPDNAEALYNRGNALWDLKRHGEALDCYDRALLLKPEYADAINNRANVLLDIKRYGEAAEGFARLLALAPGTDYAAGNLVTCRLHCCEWETLADDAASIADAVAAGKRAAFPFAFLAISPSAPAQLQCARIHVADKFPASPLPLWTGERYRHDRIRVAYLSADFHDHATAYLMAELFETHDRRRFDVAAVSFGPDPRDEMRERLRCAFGDFVDVRARTDREVAAMLRAREIDIAVDLKGFTRDSRTGIFAHRPAPIQVNYLGYPGTMGADYIDYVVADGQVLPSAHDAWFSERIVRLPDTYQVNDSKRSIAERTPSRAEAGLPDAAFVFCCFNNSYKLTPAIFDIWMRLLQAVPGSVFWLLEGNAAASRNLRREAERRGVGQERLVFAPRMDLPRHLARHRLADLFLDTLPLNAHTTASDALWAGLPVLTCMGSAFAARVGGSLLNAAGLPELITHRLDEYEAMALKLATMPALLAGLRARLEHTRATAPLFDTERFRRHIESAYIGMWERYQRGEPPESFAVASAD
ncbi:MAG: tetratricopeptide repeat protein [Aromatoleum sp.]|nr:tetratricopeptide repeat protein [Aromatoleum sp.]